jgi:hypothetical protein
MSKSVLNRRLVVGGALALAGGAAHAAALVKLVKPAVTVTEHGVGTGSAWRSLAEFEAFRKRYIDGQKVSFVVSREQTSHLTVARAGIDTTRHSDSASLGGAIETALAV